MTQITLSDLAGLDKFFEGISRPPTTEENREAYSLYLSRQAKYREAISGRWGNVAWLSKAGGVDDINTASRLFNSKTAWRECVDDMDYERIGAVVDAHNVIG